MATQDTVRIENPIIPWWLVLIEGIAAIIVGVLLFARPAATLIVLIQFLGIYWFVTGIFSIISLLWDRSGWFWKLLSGILGIIAGILIIQNPLWSTLLIPTTLAILLGTIGIVIGFLQLMDAFRGGGWGIGILGLMGILLGFLLITRPLIAGLALPWILGALLLFGGVLAILAAFALRSAGRQLAESRAQPAKAVSGEAVIPATGGPAVAATTSEMRGTAAGVESAASAAAAGTAGLVAAGVGAARDTDESLSETAGETAGAVVEDASSSAGEAGQAIGSEAGELSETVLLGNVDPANPEEMAKFTYSLEYVEGIGPVYAGKLKSIGLVTCLDLLKAGATRKGREEISERSGISSNLILEWVNHVDLFRIRGIGSEYADLLEAAGVDTVVELAQRNPSNLYDKMNEVNVAQQLVRRMPTAAQVVDWVAQAKGLPRAVTY